MALADQIRQRREAQGLRMADLARRAGISRSYLYQIEQGKSQPSAEHVYRLAFALDTTIGTLLEKAPTALDEMPAIPPGLRQLALVHTLPDEDIAMLARIRYQGRQPETVEDWWFLYQAIQRSVKQQSADEEAKSGTLDG